MAQLLLLHLHLPALCGVEVVIHHPGMRYMALQLLAQAAHAFARAMHASDSPGWYSWRQPEITNNCAEPAAQNIDKAAIDWQSKGTVSSWQT